MPRGSHSPESLPTTKPKDSELNFFHIDKIKHVPLRRVYEFGNARSLNLLVDTNEAIPATDAGVDDRYTTTY